MATEETTFRGKLGDAHEPHQVAKDAFKHIQHEIKVQLLKSRDLWKATPEMYARIKDDKDLIEWDSEKDLVLVKTAETAYGTEIFGKIRLPRLDNGYVHIRVHHPSGTTPDKVTFHSIYTDEKNNTAIQKESTSIEWFNE